MISKSTVKKIINKLEEAYPDARCSLNYSNPLQLLIAIRLSAQCTDARVNQVTPNLFSSFNTLKDFAVSKPETIENYIYSCGFYRTKSKDIVNMCKEISKEHDGIIPDNLNDLIKLPGIGRKTANLFLGEIYNKPAIVVDTHFIRITHRLGFHNTKNPTKIEKLMLNLIPPEKSLKLCHRIITHGRLICTAKNPKCEICCLNNLCKYYSCP